MTGFGDARHQQGRLSVAVEIRAVNNRYLKITTKCPDVYAALENELEKVVRDSISRGTVTVVVRVDRNGGDGQYLLNRSVLEGYLRQLTQVAESMHLPLPSDLPALLPLPGVITEANAEGVDPQADWPVVRTALEQAIERFRIFRAVEGQSMADELNSNCRIVGRQLEQVAEIAPQVVRDYRDRLHERVRELLEGMEATVGATDLIREVSIFAERCDINEEITRLRSHLEQFATFLDEKTSQGRKLEFLSQEMFREVNTIGSKANNVTIAHAVVEMKVAVEKMREILQNVE
jgi:uncharacterized protein (TIGR00255 family)